MTKPKMTNDRHTPWYIALCAVFAASPAQRDHTPPLGHVCTPLPCSCILVPTVSVLCSSLVLRAQFLCAKIGQIMFRFQNLSNVLIWHFLCQRTMGGCAGALFVRVLLYEHSESRARYLLLPLPVYRAPFSGLMCYPWALGFLVVRVHRQCLPTLSCVLVYFGLVSCLTYSWLWSLFTHVPYDVCYSYAR